MIILTQRLSYLREINTTLTISLTAEERTKTRRPCLADDGRELYLQLPRGTILENNDILTTEKETILVEIKAKSESVVTVRGETPLLLMRAVYHLANRHIPLEIDSEYIRLLPDLVLENLLKQMGLEVEYEKTPFFPEKGAYHQH